MPNRVLETTLTGRNLLSPVLAQAGRDVVAFNSTVAAANAEAGTSAQASARTQQVAANTTAAASGRAAEAATVGAGAQSRASGQVVAANTRAGESATASANVQARAHARAAESATVAARTQASANRALAAANGLLGTSLTPLTAKLGGTALALGYAAFKGMDFDRSMSRVQAATQAGAGAMGQLRDAAVQAGADTQYSATEAAGGITELAKAGVSTSDILHGGLVGSLNLAAAGEMEVADAAETAATALTVFNLSGNQMSHVADLLAAGAGKAQGSVADLSMALNQSALVAKNTGLSIEDTTGALALFASNGLLGSDAGTSFKTMLMSLNPRSDEAAKLMDELGLRAYDAQGNFVGLSAYAEQLRTGLSGLSQEQRNAALQTIFGTDAVRAATILYQQGAKGVDEWTAKVNDAGYAQRQASQLTDNLSGDLERLGGSVDTFFTNLGEGTQGPLRLAVQMLTGLVNIGGDVLGFFNSLPGPLQVGIVALLTLTTLRGPLTRLFDTIVLNGRVAGATMLQAARNAGGFRSALSGLVGAINPVTLALAVLTMGVAQFAQDTAEVDARMDAASDAGDSFRATLAQQKGELNAATGEAAKLAVQAAGLKQVFDDLDVSTRTVSEALSGNADAYESTLRKLEEYDARQMAIRDAGNPLATVMDMLTGKAHENADAWKEANNAADGFFVNATVVDAGGFAAWAEAKNAADGISEAVLAAAGGSEEFAKELQGTRDAADQAREAIDLYKLTLDQLTGAHVTMAEAQAAFYAAVDRGKDAVKELGGAVLDAAGDFNVQTENGRAAQDVLLGVADKANLVIGTMIQQGASAKDVAAADARMREQFIITAGQMGINRQQAELLAQKYYGIPEERRTKIVADVTQASGAIASIQTKIGQLQDKTITITTRTVYQDGSASVRQNRATLGAIGGVVHAYAGGGVELTPMQGGVAQVVGANTWRVIGDRVTDDEAYIPLNRGLARSHDVLGYAAHAMGYGLVPSSPAAMPGYGPAVAIGIDYDRMAAAIARALPAASSGPLLAIAEYNEAPNSRPRDIAQELSYDLRVAGRR